MGEALEKSRSNEMSILTPIGRLYKLSRFRVVIGKPDTRRAEYEYAEDNRKRHFTREPSFGFRFSISSY